MNPTNPNSNRTKPAAPNQPRPDVPHIGPFQVLAELGRGGMGAVYRAKDPRLGREVAVKVLPPELGRDAVAKERFLREARAQAAVEHDHIVTIHEVNEENGVAYIVMPLLKGQPLSAALKLNPRPPVPELVRIGREIAEGLAAAHAAGLVHRDIKPGNVWLEAPKRRVKILDFGIARGAGTGTGSRDDANPLTKRNELLGTPQYMSPEQARSKPVDHRSDLFSLGVVLYQMATGERPFNGDNEFDVMAAVVNEHPASAADVVPGFPPALSDLIDRLLAKSPAARPASAATVAAELEQILNGISMRAVVVLPLPDAAPDAPNPWAELDTTHAEPETRGPGATRRAVRAPEPEGDTEDEPRTYRGPANTGGAPKWLLPAAVTGLLAAVALIVFVVNGRKGGDDGAKGGAPPDSTAGSNTKIGQKQKTIPKVDHERELALAAGPYAELKLALDDGTGRKIPAGGVLPGAAFAVTELNFQSGPRPPDDFRAGTLIPKLVAAGRVEQLLDRTGHLGYWTDDEWEAFCNTKSKGALVQINVFAPLTDRSLNLVKGFPNLTGMRFTVKHAEPLQLGGLRDLTKLESLALDELGRDIAPVPDTWNALSQLKVRSLFLWSVHGLTPEAAGVLAAAPDLTELGVSGEKLTEPAVLKLFERKELTSVAVSECGALTDAVCDAIANRPQLNYAELARVPQITAKGVAAIRAKHPDATIDWDGDPPAPKTEPKTGALAGLHFDGKTASVVVPKLSFDGKLPITLEAVLTPDAVGTTHFLLLGEPGGGFGLGKGGELGVGFYDGKEWLTDYATEPLKVGAPVHVAAVVTETGYTLFVDGKQRGWKNVPLKALPKTEPPTVLGRATKFAGGGDRFAGTMHAVRVSKGARYERDKTFAAPRTLAKDADTLLLYAFDEGTGDVVRDRSGNGYDGEIVGGKWVK